MAAAGLFPRGLLPGLARRELGLMLGLLPLETLLGARLDFSAGRRYGATIWVRTARQSGCDEAAELSDDFRCLSAWQGL